MPKPKHEQGVHIPPKHGDVPPHILKELFDLKEKVGKLEGMVEILLREKNN